MLTIHLLTNALLDLTLNRLDGQHFKCPKMNSKLSAIFDLSSMRRYALNGYAMQTCFKFKSRRSVAAMAILLVASVAGTAALATEARLCMTRRQGTTKQRSQVTGTRSGEQAGTAADSRGIALPAAKPLI
jgi:hypothetical protein